MGFKKGNKLGKKFTSENQPESKGKRLPDAALKKALEAYGYKPSKEQILQIFAAALAKGAEDLACDTKDKDMPMVMRIVGKELLGKNSWRTVLDILDRLFGKPKQQQDITTNGKDIGPSPTFDNTVLLFPKEDE